VVSAALALVVCLRSSAGKRRPQQLECLVPEARRRGRDSGSPVGRRVTEDLSFRRAGCSRVQQAALALTLSSPLLLPFGHSSSSEAALPVRQPAPVAVAAFRRNHRTHKCVSRVLAPPSPLKQQGRRRSVSGGANFVNRFAPPSRNCTPFCAAFLPCFGKVAKGSFWRITKNTWDRIGGHLAADPNAKTSYPSILVK